MADGEMPVECPACRQTLVLDLSGQKFTLADYDDSSLPVTAVHPGTPTDTVEERLFWLTIAHGRHDVATKVEHLFGDADCPRCGHHFRVADALP